MDIHIPTSHCKIEARPLRLTHAPSIVTLTFHHYAVGGIGTSFSVSVHLTPDDARALATALADYADEIDAARQLSPNATLVEDNHANR